MINILSSLFVCLFFFLLLFKTVQKKAKNKELAVKWINQWVVSSSLWHSAFHLWD